MIKKADLIVQSILSVLILGTLTPWPAGPGVLWMSLITGGWQLLSSLISVIVPGPMFRGKVIHIVAALPCLLTLLIHSAGPKPECWRWYLLVPTWLLTIYYYMLTWRSVLTGGRKQSSFLPHINF